MPSYLDALTEEQLKHMDGTIDTFLAGYKNWGIARGAQQRTVLFFPGGLGSELTQARQPFDPTGGTAYDYDQIWYDIARIRGPEKAALHMAMRREAADSQATAARKPVAKSRLVSGDGQHGRTNLLATDERIKHC